MNVTEAQRRLLELCAIRVEQASVDWSLIARQAQFDGGLEAMWRGVTTEKSAAAKRSAMVLRRGLRSPASLARKVEAELEAAAQAGARLITVLDQEYPANPRLIPNLPPFLFTGVIFSTRTRCPSPLWAPARHRTTACAEPHACRVCSPSTA